MRDCIKEPTLSLSSQYERNLDDIEDASSRLFLILLKNFYKTQQKKLIESKGRAEDIEGKFREIKDSVL
ncbi:MAG: hypothetical protein HYW01_10305 [Deltaproteobacteria bacterium]|nr:hypothetical protein [Deltaproteobacteria bacterium]